MKTYKLIIELSDSTLEQMASIEEALKESDPGAAIAQLITSTALKKKLEEMDSVTVNMDTIVDDKELNIIKRSVVSVGAIVIAQEARIRKKREQE